MIQFTVVGHAMPGGSKKAFVHPATGRAVIVDASNNKSWRQEVSVAASAAMERAAATDPLRCALSVSFVFYRPRPKGHYGTGRNAGVVKDSAPEFPTTRPDVLKLARAVEDSMTGIVYADDSQIVDERLVKRWGLPERVEIVVRPMDLPDTLELVDGAMTAPMLPLSV